MTIDREVANEVKRLLAAGRLSQRKIARQVGISRGTVEKIASGRWQPKREWMRLQVPTGPAVRCQECGAMAQMPCMACQLRAIQKKARGQRD
jgi:hypothetical protein